MIAGITLRPITEADLTLLERVYASTREDELSVTGWSAEQKQQFLHQQFTAQHTYYQQHYEDSRFDVILRDGEPAGRLYVARWDKELRVIDIALLPEHRRQGIGTALLRELLAEAHAAGKPVRIHVEHNNPAMGLYQRLGFQRSGDTGVYYLMECRP